MSTFRLFIPYALLSLVVAVSAGCKDDPATATPDDETPGGPAPVVTNDSESLLSGRIIRAQTEDEAVPNATITIGASSTTTNVKGEFALLVPRNTPYRMTVAAEGYFKLIEQEQLVKTESLEQGDTSLLRTETANLLAGMLPGRDASKGIVVVKVAPKGNCLTEDGATLTLDPPGNAQLVYFGDLVPDASRTSVKGGTAFSALFYNVDVDVPLSVSVTSPPCAQVPFPVDVDEVTYTGSATAEAGDALTYVRLYLD